MKRAESENKNRKGFMSGVFILSASTLIVKVIGLAYKIPMMNILGAQGMGYFNSAYEVYALLCVISTAGLPLALSMMISSRDSRGDGTAVKRVYNTALTVFLTLGITGSLVMAFFGQPLANYIENPEAYGCILAISPALICVCISSAVRGYFQGINRMMPTALSQLIEAVCKLVFGIIFASYALKKGYGVAYAAAFAVVGLSVGTLLSAIYLLLLKFFDDKRSPALVIKNGEKETGVAKQLLSIAIPITLGSAVLSLGRVVDMALIMRRLVDIGHSSAGANEIYGAYTTMAIPVFSLIPSLVTPVALALVPQISAAISQQDKATQISVVRASMRLTSLFAMPASMGVTLYARDILELLFVQQKEAIDVAAPLLAMLGISILFSCTITTTNAILQSYGQTKKPIIAMVVGTLVKALGAYVLIGNASVGIMGAPISTLACDLTITVINLYYVNKYVPRIDKVQRLYARPFAASLAMVCVSLAAYMLMIHFGNSNIIAFVAAMIAAVISYLFFAAVFGALEREDILSMPFGETLLKIFGRVGFLEKLK